MYLKNSRIELRKSVYKIYEMSLHIQSFFVVLKCQENYPSKCHPISRVSIDGHIAFGLSLIVSL